MNRIERAIFGMNDLEKKQARRAEIAADETTDEQGRPLGTWESTGYSATDDEAHRDVVYRAPSAVMQTIYFFLSQIKLFARGKGVYVMLLSAIMIPIVAFLMGDMMDMFSTMFSTSTANGYMGFLLVMMPFFLSLFTAMLCGKQVPTELSERTAYMNFALPVSRGSFVVGKFLAGFVVCMGIFIFAFSAALFTSMTKYGNFDEGGLAAAMVYTIVAAFAYAATAFALGCVLRRANVFLPFLITLFLIPMVMIALNNYAHIDWSVLVYLPFCLPDMACSALTSNASASPIGMVNYALGGSLFDDVSMIGSVIAGIVWGVGFLLLATFIIKRREM